MKYIGLSMKITANCALPEKIEIAKHKSAAKVAMKKDVVITNAWASWRQNFLDRPLMRNITIVRQLRYWRIGMLIIESNHRERTRRETEVRRIEMSDVK